MGKEYVLGGVHYGTRKAVETRAKTLLHGTEPNQELAGADLAFVLALLARHPRADEKRGTGVKAVYVVAGRFSRAFWIRRTDDTEIDFSIGKCL